MRIKRSLSLVLAALMVAALTGCGAGKGKSAAMSIQPAQLTEEEAAITELLGVSIAAHHIFDFQIGKDGSGVQSFQVAVYELADGDWKPIAQYREAFTEAGGRLNLEFGKLTEGVRAAVQSEGASTEKDIPVKGGDSASTLAYATSALTNSADLEFDKEVPLVVQIATTKSEINFYDVKYFDMPREYMKQGYEHVYAVTVMFSQKTVAQLDKE